MKKISIIIMIVIINMLITSNVFAASTFQVELEADKTEVKEGDTVTIAISLTNLNVTTGEQGIGAYLAKIEYDTNIFENAVFSGNTNWEGSMKNGNITGVTTDGEVVKQKDTIATLSLTVKDNAKVGDSTVTILNFVGSDAVNDISASNQSIQLKVIDENNNNNGSNDNNTDNGSDENDDNNTNNDSNETNDGNTNDGVSDNTNSNDNANNNGNTGTTDTITDNDIPNEKLPQTGNKVGIYGISIAIFIVLIIAIYIYYRKVILNGKNIKLK